MSDTKKVGFWYSKNEPHLPMPKERDKPWEGQTDFVSRLHAVEARAQCSHYRGWSGCRICNCANGSREFSHLGFTWPEGLSHYVTEHNVKPDQEFIDFVTQRKGASS